MAQDNNTCVSGTLGKDVDLRYTATGRAVASVSIAVNRRWQQNGEWQEQTSWFNLVLWGDIGEHAAASLSKGDRVVVAGRLEQRSYEDKEGNNRSITEIVVDDIGPSLRWAEATVERIQRDEAPKQSKATEYDDPEEPF